MCKNMNEFERLVKEIQDKKEIADAIKKQIDELEEELKSYMKKRQKEELEAKESNVLVSYKPVISMKFNKDGFITANGKDVYERYCTPSKSMRLNYKKPKKVKSAA